MFIFLIYFSVKLVAPENMKMNFLQLSGEQNYANSVVRLLALDGGFNKTCSISLPSL